MAAIPGIGQRAEAVDAVPRRPALQRALGRDWKIAWLFILPLVLVLHTSSRKQSLGTPPIWLKDMSTTTLTI